MSAFTPATEPDVVRLLGELDPMFVSRILATGASIDEIDEALREVQDETNFGDAPHVPSSPRVIEVLAALRGLGADDDALADLDGLDYATP